MSIIQAKDLSKHFRVPVRQKGRLAAVRNLFSLEHTHRVAVDAVSFAVNRGEMVGYVGPNGAGKSTTIKMLIGILLPTAGEISVAGLVPHRDRKQLAQSIGVVFGQKSQLWWDVPVIESLRLLKEIYKIPDHVYNSNMDLFKGLLDLHEFQNTPVRQLSLGQRMRSDLAAALLHSPDILFLDEPTIGVDVVAKERFRSFIKQLNQERQVTILLTTHDLADIEKLCDRLMIIDKGRIIYDGPVAGLKEQVTPYRVLLVDFADGVTDVASGLAELIQRNGQHARFRFNRHQVSASELIVELAGRYAIKDISVEEPEIETTIREIYGRTAANQDWKSS
jgi:ABC-2 type transport system ATP-binding protein